MGKAFPGAGVMCVEARGRDDEDSGQAQHSRDEWRKLEVLKANVETFIIVSSADASGAFNTEFATLNLHRLIEREISRRGNSPRMPLGAREAAQEFETVGDGQGQARYPATGADYE